MMGWKRSARRNTSGVVLRRIRCAEAQDISRLCTIMSVPCIYILCAVFFGLSGCVDAMQFVESCESNEKLAGLCDGVQRLQEYHAAQGHADRTADFFRLADRRWVTCGCVFSDVLSLMPNHQRHEAKSNSIRRRFICIR